MEMTQEELAKLTGYSDRSMIAKIEQGLVDLSQSKIERFAKVFGVAPNTLTGWSGNVNGMSIGEKIKAARLAKGMTQEELGQLLGVQKSAVAKYENGRVVNIKRSTLKKISDVLNIRPAELIIESSPEDLAELTATILQDTDLMAMIEKYLTLSAADQKAVRAMVDALAAKGE